MERERKQTGGVRAWVAADCRGLEGTPSRDPARALDALFAATPAGWLRRIPGRETFVAGDELGSWGLAGAVVKRFGPQDGHDRWFERLLRIDPRSAARREAENLEQLTRQGFAVPRPLAWFEESAPRGRSAVVMEAVHHDQTLCEVLASTDPRGRRSWLESTAALVARLHGAGWYHRDLYCEHLIVTAAGDVRTDTPELVLLDLGRARQQTRPRARWFVKDLAALHHSAPESVGPRERLRFLVRYLAAREIPRGTPGSSEWRERRALARAVLRKATRIARHVPRYQDPESARALPVREPRG